MVGPRLHRFLVSSVFGVFLASNLALFTPLTVFLGNSDEFAVGFFVMLPHLLRVIVAVAALAGLVGMLLPAKAHRSYLAVLAMLGLLVWMQGNILVWDYGPLDGRQIDWAEGAWRGWGDLALWVLALVVAFLLPPRRQELLLNLAVALFTIQMVLALVLGARDMSRLNRPDALVSRSETLEQLYAFSRSKNVLHLIMDGFQGDIFEEILAEGQTGKWISDALDGFVFYRNNLSAFPYTHMSMPAVLGGRIYRNDVPIRTFREQVFGDKTILNAVFDPGYEVDVAAEAVLVNVCTLGQHTNAYIVPQTSHISREQYAADEALKLLDLSLFRAAPHFLKQRVYNDQLWLLQSVSDNLSFMQLAFFAHNFFLRRWRESMTVTRDAPVYKLFHLMLSHNPMVATADCRYAGQTLATVRPNVLNQARCSLLETVRVLERMKELGVYDEALIILMGDHGAWVPPKGGMEGIGTDGQLKPWVLEAYQHALALPLLAIKLPGAKGALRISSVPTWTVDVPDTISAILDLPEEFGRRNILSLRPDEPRERRHYYYQYARGEWEAEYLLPIQEFIVNGDVYDSASWRYGELFPPASLTE